MDIGSLTGAIRIEDQLTGVLETSIHRIKSFKDQFDGMAGAVLVGAGIVTGAITGAVASIVALGEKGSTILGVEEAFDHLALAAGSTGDALIRGLDQGVRGTIDSMELMQATTRLLSSGIKLSEADMKLMGSTAREMGKATGTDAAQGLNTLSQALLTGNTRSLKRFGINVDLIKSEKDFAASLGTTRDQLNESGRLEAHRIAMLEGMRTKLNALGESELSFKERIQQVTVAVGNWFDSLAKGVAKSAAVNHAFDSISAAISETFGGTSQTLLEWILRWVDRFANFASRYGPPIIRTLGNIKDKIVEIWQTVTRAWDLVPDWFKNIAKEAALAGGAVYLTSKTLGALGGGSSDLLGTVASFATITSGLRDFTSVLISAGPKIITQTKGIYQALSIFYLLGSFAGGGVIGGIGGVLTGIGAGLMALAATPVGIASLMTALAASIYQVVNAVRSFGDNWKAGGGTLWGFLTLKEDDNFVRRWLGLAQAIDSVAEAIKRAKAAGTFSVDPSGFQHYGTKADTNLVAPEKPPKPTPLPDFTISPAEEYAKRVADMVKSFREAEQPLNVFTAAFGKLTMAQKDNFSVQQMLVPEMDKLLAAHRTLTPEMQRVYDAATNTRLAYLAQDQALLESSGLTLAQIDNMKQLGMTEKDIAVAFHVSTEALTKRTAAMQKTQSQTEALAAFSEAYAEQERQTAKRRADIALASDRAISDSRRELDNLLRQNSMTTTAFEISKIHEEETARIVAFSATGASATAIQEFTDLQKRLSRERVDALLVDNDALRRNNVATLEDIRDRAWNTYKAMIAAPEEYSQAAIEAQHKIALAASEDADVTRTKWDEAWEHLKSELTDIGKGVGHDIAGLVGEGIRTGDWSQFENNLRDALANGMGQAAAAAVNMIVPGLGTILEPLLSAISDKLLGAFGLGTKGRDLVKDFANSFMKPGDLAAGISGFDRLHQELAKLGSEGERLWINLTQGVGRNNPQEALRAIDAIRGALANVPQTMDDQAAAAGFSTTADLKAAADQAVHLYEYIRDSGKYSAETIQKAWERANEALIAAGDQAAISAKQTTDQIKTLQDELDGFSASLQAEADAPEYDEMGNRIYGVVELQQMARKAQIEAEINALKDQQQAVQGAVKGITDSIADSTADSSEAIMHGYSDAASAVEALLAGTTRHVMNETASATEDASREGVRIIDDVLAAHEFVAKLKFIYDLPGSVSINANVTTNEEEPHLAGGGVVGRPTRAIVGDSPSGPEAITPISELFDKMDELYGDRQGPQVVHNHYHTWNTIDGPSTRKFVESPDFAEGFVRAYSTNATGIRSGMENV